MVSLEIKGKRYGLCSICERYGKMSKDHIPPKCCGNKGKFTFTRIHNDPMQRKKYIVQNGITFHFICDECNNLMGARYDEALADFRKLFFELEEKGYSDIVIDFEKIAKCIAEHLPASYERSNSTIQEAFSAFYNEIDGYDEFLKKYSTYCYMYPYEDSIFILNEYFTHNIYGNTAEDGLFSSLYFYPFAFILSEKNKFGERSDIIYCMQHKTPFVTLAEDWYDGPNMYKSAIWPADVNDRKVIFLGDTSKSSVIVFNNNGE